MTCIKSLSSSQHSEISRQLLIRNCTGKVSSQLAFTVSSTLVRHSGFNLSSKQNEGGSEPSDKPVFCGQILRLVMTNSVLIRAYLLGFLLLLPIIITSVTLCFRFMRSINNIILIYLSRNLIQLYSNISLFVSLGQLTKLHVLFGVYHQRSFIFQLQLQEICR